MKLEILGIKKEAEKDGFKVLTIDTSKAKHQGIAWRTLGDFGKKKWENWIVLNRAKERLKFIYL